MSGGPKIDGRTIHVFGYVAFKYAPKRDSIVLRLAVILKPTGFPQLLWHVVH